jgi:hypothetical protein
VIREEELFLGDEVRWIWERGRSLYFLQVSHLFLKKGGGRHQGQLFRGRGPNPGGSTGRFSQYNRGGFTHSRGRAGVAQGSSSSRTATQRSFTFPHCDIYGWFHLGDCRVTIRGVLFIGMRAITREFVHMWRIWAFQEKLPK